jgi:hypothetical protein
MLVGNVGNFMSIYTKEDGVEKERKDTEREMFGILVVGQLCIQHQVFEIFPSPSPPISNVMSVESL